jgi:hypothetical protein
VAVSSTAICNSALIKVGAERIISLDDDNPRAVLMKEQFEKIRDELLYSHPWNFATKRQELALLTTAPDSNFSYQFQLPNDCLRVVETDLEGANRWRVEGRKLLCDFSEIHIAFISNDIDYADYTPAFVEALACKIAADVAYSLVQNASLKELLMKEAEMKLRLARSFDAQESVGDRVYADGWLNSRF